MHWGSEPDLVGPRHYFRVALMARALARYLPPSGRREAAKAAEPIPRVLDAGAGRGTLARRLAGQGYRVVAVEESASFVQYLRVRRPRGTQPGLAVVRGDVAALPFGAARFDGIVCGEVLEHVADDAAALAELARALRPGGVLVATVPAGRGRYGWLDRWAGHVRRYDRSDLARRAAGAGLVVRELHHWGFPFGLLYERLVQRPVLAHHARAGAAPGLARRVGRAPVVARGLGLLFDLDRACDALPWGPGLLLVAQRPLSADNAD